MLKIILFVVLCLYAPEILGCGGFFCSRNAPVVQEGEKILFSRLDDEMVRAMISISYSGPSEDFSWVLPLPSVPEFGVGSDAVFSAVMSATEPAFQINWKDGDSCGTQCFFRAFSSDNAGPTAEDGGAEQPKVEVLAEGDVGPFRYQVVFAPSLEGKPMFDWLNENEYDQPPEAASLIDYYAGIGNVFVALKLLKNKEAGDIQPIVLKYKSPKALSCIPITLTQVAVADNLPIFVWLLGDARALPINYFDVQPDFSSFNWIDCPSISFNGFFGSGASSGGKSCYDQYVDVVRTAIDSVGGKGFVTEYAGSTDVLANRIWSDSQEQRFDKTKLAGIWNVGEFLQEIVSMGIPRDATAQALIRAAIPKPPVSDLPETCQTDAQFYTFNVDQCVGYIANWNFEPSKLADQIDQQLVQPLRDAQTHVDSYTKITRMFTTMKSDQMTRDPYFSFNADLPDVPRIHEAEGVCETIGNSRVATLTFSNGVSRKINGTGSCGGWNVGPLPPVLGAPTIRVLATSGNARTVQLADVETESASIGSVDCSGAQEASCELNGVAFTVPASGPECQSICPGDPSESTCPTCPSSYENGATLFSVNGRLIFVVSLLVMIIF